MNFSSVTLEKLAILTNLMQQKKSINNKDDSDNLRAWQPDDALTASFSHHLDYSDCEYNVTDLEALEDHRRKEWRNPNDPLASEKADMHMIFTVISGIEVSLAIFFNIGLLCGFRFLKYQKGIWLQSYNLFTDSRAWLVAAYSVNCIYLGVMLLLHTFQRFYWIADYWATSKLSCGLRPPLFLVCELI